MRVSERSSTSLDELERSGWWLVDGTEVHLTNLDKVLFPGPPPLTKRDVVRYYADVAPYLLPYLAGRPVNAHRYPDGVTRPGFWHKEVPGHAPDWLTQWHNTDADPGETECYAVLDSVPALVWMANFAGVELHPWTSRIPACGSRRGPWWTSTRATRRRSPRWWSWPGSSVRHWTT